MRTRSESAAALWGVGIIALFVVLILAVCGAVGGVVGDRRHPYWPRTGAVRSR